MSTDLGSDSLGDGLLEGLREAVAWRKGELVLETIDVDPANLNRDAKPDPILRVVRKTLD
jgi:hypothetical protein